jgi:DNA-binding XRE family transcriptional regulator
LASDAAANTVGVEPLDAAEVVELEVVLLLPQPTAKAEIPIAASPTAARLAGFEPDNGSLVLDLSTRLTTGSEHPTRILAVMAASSLRERRLECGLTQAELAAQAGVSRQLVAAVEAGRNTPAVDAALGLARALATSVEELFADDQPPGVVAALGGGLRDGAPLRVGRVADQLVAAELADHGISGATWAKPDGVMDGDKLRLFPGASPAGVVLAGCDPALGVAGAMLDGLGPRSLLTISASTGKALHALQRGGVHAAVVHGLPHGLPEPPVPIVRWHLARWQVGLAVPSKLRGRSLEVVLRSNLPVAQRDPAAASQQAFERARIAAGIGPLPGPHATGHLDAARIAATFDCAAVTTEGAAQSFGLHFLALEDHVVEIWVGEPWLAHPGINALGEVLATRGFTERVAHFGGYDLTRCGERVDTA